MGCGILNYPFLVLEFGIIPSIFLTFISAFSSYAGILLYIELNADLDAIIRYQPSHAILCHV